MKAVVIDEAFFPRKRLEGILLAEGFTEVVVFESFTKALESLQADPISIDYAFVGYSAMAGFYQKLKQLKELVGEIPTAICCTKDISLSLVPSKEAGYTHILLKRYSVEDVRSIIGASDLLEPNKEVI